jgi:hypothetical protein
VSRHDRGHLPELPTGVSPVFPEDFTAPCGCERVCAAAAGLRSGVTNRVRDAAPRVRGIEALLDGTAGAPCAGAKVQPTDSQNSETNVTDKKRALRILAKSIYRELTAQGYDERQIVSLATELISEVTQKMSAGSTASP